MLGLHALTEVRFTPMGTLGELTLVQAARASWERWTAVLQSAQLALQAASRSPVQVGSIAKIQRIVKLEIRSDIEKMLSVSLCHSIFDVSCNEDKNIFSYPAKSQILRNTPGMIFFPLLRKV